MSTSITTHQAKGISFKTESYVTLGLSGGYMRIVIPTMRGFDLDKVPDETELIVHTSDPEVFDHFCDIARVADGAIGSLRPEPDPQETT